MNSVTEVNNVRLIATSNETTEQPPRKTLKQTVFDCIGALLDECNSQVGGCLYDVVLNVIEPPLFLTLLDECRGNQTKVAKMLAMSRGTLRKKFKRYRIDKDSRIKCHQPINQMEQALTPMYESFLHTIENYVENMQGQPITGLYEMVLAEIEEPLLKAVMAAMENNQTVATKVVGLSRNTFRKKLKLYGLDS